MRTSRIAKESGRVAKLLSNETHTNSSITGRRATRSSGTTSAYFQSSSASSSSSPNGNPPQPFASNSHEIEQDSDSSLSSAHSAFSLDIEDAPFSRKRKRISPATAATSTITSSHTSPRKRPSKVKKEEVSIKVELEDAVPAPTAGRKPKRQPTKKTADPITGEVTIHAPANWKETYDTLKEMRKHITAPVDTMGCERLALPTDSPKDQRFQTLVSLMLSSQTKDTVTAVVVRNMQSSLPGGLNATSIASSTYEQIFSLIKPVGFNATKTKFLLAAANTCLSTYDGDIPSTYEGLISLAGVGPKMAHLCMSAAWGKTEGIGVDTHVHRITNLWGWHDTRNAEETRVSLETWLPRDKWREINGLIVGLGQTVCASVVGARRCGECDIGGRGLCPSMVVKKVVVKRQRGEKRVVKKEGEEVKEEVTVKEEVVEEI